MNGKRCLKQDIKELWIECFHDSPEFVRLFFGSVYEDGYVYSSYEGDKLVCALQALPYEFEFCGTAVSVRYIAGVSTAAEYRNRHLMTDLLSRALKECGDALFAVLLPAEDWLYSFYRKFGFASVIHNQRIALTGSDIDFDRCLPSDFCEKDCYGFYSRKLRERGCCMLHGFGDFQTIVEDNRLSGGQVLCVRDRYHSVKAVAFCYPEENGVVVKDMAYERGWRDRMVATVVAAFPSRRVTAIVPHGSERFGMIRILSVENTLRRLASYCPNISLEIRVVDTLIERNSGVFRINRGCVSRGEGKGDYILSAEELAEFVFGSLQLGDTRTECRPSMSLMLE